jgi:hypothetical protein
MQNVKLDVKKLQTPNFKTSKETPSFKLQIEENAIEI